MGMVIIIMWDLSRQILEVVLNYCTDKRCTFHYLWRPNQMNSTIKISEFKRSDSGAEIRNNRSWVSVKGIITHNFREK
jgi:hypothetical protein